MGWWPLLVLALGLTALVISASRARALCVLSVRRGRVEVTRGALPGGVLDAMQDVLRRGGIERAVIHVMRDGAHVRVTGSGLDEFTLQRLRNVLGTYPLAKLLAAAPRERNIGQQLGNTFSARARRRLSRFLRERR